MFVNKDEIRDRVNARVERWTHTFLYQEFRPSQSEIEYIEYYFSNERMSTKKVATSDRNEFFLLHVP